MTILGAVPSPILLIRLLFAIPSGLVAPTLLFAGSGLTGLMTPDMDVLGVGGNGDRAGGIGLCIWGLGDGDGLLPKRESNVFFCSEGTDSRRSMPDRGGGTGERDGNTAGSAGGGCGEGPLNMSSKPCVCDADFSAGPEQWLVLSAGRAVRRRIGGREEMDIPAGPGAFDCC
jgi:hypothetical protein